jgi:acetylornithine deacetylase
MTSDPTRLPEVLSRIDAGRLNRLLIEAVEAYSPTFAEEPATVVFEAALLREGVPCWRMPVPVHPGAGPRANLLVRLGPDPVELMWIGHVDTVSAADDPEGSLGVEHVGDTLQGLGTADMKGACAAAVEAVLAVAASGIPLTKGFILALVVGEEEYGDGSETLLRTHVAPRVVIGEPTSLVPCLDHYGYIEFRLVSEGSVAHAALPETGRNAIQGMLKWLGEALERLGTLPATTPAAINLRDIKGGEPRFVVPDRCKALLDVHVPPGTPLEAVTSRIEEARQTVLESSDGLGLSWREKFRAEPFAALTGDSRIDPLRQAFVEVSLPWSPGAFRSHSDAGLFHEKGALTMVCGPGRLEQAHSAQEFISLSEVALAARLYAAMILSCCT